MKKKTLYIFLVICCFSLFSSAKQMMKAQANDACCKKRTDNEEIKPGAKMQGRTGFELSPLTFFLSDI